MRADSFALQRLLHRGVTIFCENYSYSLLSCWRIVLYLQLLLFAPTYFDNDTTVNIWQNLMLFTACGGLLVCFVGKTCSPLAGSLPYRICSGVMGTVGMLLTALAFHGIAPAATLLVGLALACISFATTTAIWLQKFISQGLDSVAWNYLVGILVGTTLFFVIRSALGSYSIYLFAVFPLVACLNVKNPAPGATLPDGFLDATAEASLNQADSSPSGTYRLFAVLLLCCVAFGLIAQQAFEPTPLSPSDYFVLLVSVDVLVSFIAKIVASFAHAKHSFIVFYLIIPFVCISTIGLAAFVSPTSNVAFYCIAQTAFQLTSFMTVFKISETFRKKTDEVAPFIGAIIIMQHAGQLAGKVMGASLPNPEFMAIAVLTIMVVASLTMMGNTASFTLANPKRVNSKLEAIHAISRRYRLTPREVDILELWGMGHTSNYIEEQLFIAKSTVKTHLSHIYQKTGTENKEELLQLIDEEAAGETHKGNPQLTRS